MRVAPKHGCVELTSNDQQTGTPAEILRIPGDTKHVAELAGLGRADVTTVKWFEKRA
jgi:hypothetical protein